MEIATLAAILLTALATAGALVGGFGDAIARVLEPVLPQDASPTLTRYARFALFTASLLGGLRLGELGALGGVRFVPPGQPPPAGLTGSQALIEVYKTLAGSLRAGAFLLLVIFGGALVLRAGLALYASAGERRRREREEAVARTREAAALREKEAAERERHPASRR